MTKAKMAWFLFVKVENEKWKHSSHSSNKEAILSEQKEWEEWETIIVQLAPEDVEPALKKMNEEYCKTPHFHLYDGKFLQKIATFGNTNDACQEASRIMAERYGLETNKYHLRWDVILRDADYTRIWESEGGDFRIVAENY